MVRIAATQTVSVDHSSPIHRRLGTTTVRVREADLHAFSVRPSALTEAGCRWRLFAACSFAVGHLTLRERRM